MARRVAPVALRSVLIAALALVAAGCGKSKERELYEQRQAACASILGMPLLDARQTVFQRELLVGCTGSSNLTLARLVGDTCGGADSGAYQESVCQSVFQWFANDADLCDVGNGCVYGCEARFNEADALANGTGAVVCAVRWIQ